MKTPKQEAFKLLERLPDDVSMDALLAELHFIASVQRGIEDARRGDVVTQDEVRQRLNSWLESSGREQLSGT
jgi:predicted transcriptional regulator